MKGHRELIAMRRQGFKPAAVWISDDRCPIDWARWGDHPQICVAGDTPELEDFRFLVGIELVMVDGCDAQRVDRIAKACKVHAKRVIANTFQTTTTGLQLVSIADTAEVMTWPK